MRQDRHAKTYPDVLGALAESAKDHFRTRGSRRTEQEVVLDKPDPVVTDPVSQFDLVKGLLVQRVPVYVCALVWALHFK